jgi:long-chain fatty acid transport protein
MGDGLSAAAIGRGGATVVQQTSPLDAVQGNPAGLAYLERGTMDLDLVGVAAAGSFRNGYNPNARLGSFAGALPYGAYATPLHHSVWVFAAAATPEILMRANWHYVDAPGTAGVTYGYQKQDTQIVGFRSSASIARPLGRKWSAGASVGVVYNQNHLQAPYIFQQQPALKGLKVLVDLTTRGYGWNGSAGVQWHPSSSLRAGAAWKSGTTIHTAGELDGSASALFAALGVPSDPTFTYHAQVLNHLPQAFNAGLWWRTRSRLAFSFEGGMTAWSQAFQQLPILLTNGSNAVINSVAGSSTLQDAVPLNWCNQFALHGGAEYPLSEHWSVRGGYSFRNDPVPSSTLTPLTAAIMKQSVATGAGWSGHSWSYDAAYQVQLPSSASVRTSGLQAGEYNNSNVRVWFQSLTLSLRKTF